jgi:hypothetical protein
MSTLHPARVTTTSWRVASVQAEPPHTVLTIAAASIAPILYLLYLDRYAVNSFVDETGRSSHWSMGRSTASFR